MKTPTVKIKHIAGDIICSISYKNKIVKAGYKNDGTVFILPDNHIVNTPLEFTKIGNSMWNDVCKKFNMNPGNALEAGLIDLKYCKQMQFASMIGYDLCNMIYNKEKSHRNICKFFEDNLK